MYPVSLVSGLGKLLFSTLSSSSNSYTSSKVLFFKVSIWEIVVEKIVLFFFVILSINSSIISSSVAISILPWID